MKNYTLLIISIIFSISCVYSQETLNTGTKKEGCIIGNCNNGYGVYIYKDSTRYEGNFINSKAEGEGICYYPDGDIYIGNWKAHDFHGQGTFIYGGKKLVGEWAQGKLIKKTVLGNTDKGIKSKVWALIVGVANYPNYRSLKYPDDDAYQLFSFLKSPEGGALKEEQIKILVDENATYNKITTTMEDIFSKASENDVILFYFSGHGVNGAFLPHDYSDEATKLKFNVILDKMEQSKAKHKILIADACNSGSISNSMQDELAMKGEIDLTINKYYEALGKTTGGMAMLLSSSANENSIEKSGMRHGVFSYYLIEGLAGAADYDNNEIITVQEVFSYVKGSVQDYTNYYQNPMLIGNFDPNIPLGVLRD